MSGNIPKMDGLFMDMPDISNVLLLQPALQVLYLKDLSTQLTISIGHIPRTNVAQSKERYVFFLQVNVVRLSVVIIIIIAYICRVLILCQANMLGMSLFI